MRLWFMGSGPFAASCLKHMSGELPFEKIVTGAPTQAGRGLKERPSRVEEAAAEIGLPVERTGPLSENETLSAAMHSSPPDLILVVDFAQLIKEPFLNGPRHGCLNIHPSLLPRWRGAAPIQRALMAGDAETGVTVFRLVKAMDAGPILLQTSIPVEVTTGSAELFDVLALMGSQIAVHGVKSIIDGSCQFSDQDSELTTYAGKIDKTEAQVSWQLAVMEAHNTVRALDSSIGAFVTVEGRRLKLWRTLPVEGGGRPGEVLDLLDGDPVIACLEGAMRLCEVQAEGKKRVSGAEWACGGRLAIGEVLT